MLIIQFIFRFLSQGLLSWKVIQMMEKTHNHKCKIKISKRWWKNKKRKEKTRKNTMMREEKINRRWIILGQGSHISKKSFTKIMWFDLWSKLGLHYIQSLFSPSPWGFPGSHPKSGLPWSSTCHGPSALV